MTKPRMPKTRAVETAATSSERAPSAPSPKRGPRPARDGRTVDAPAGRAPSGATGQGWKTGAFALSASQVCVICASSPLALTQLLIAYHLLRALDRNREELRRPR